MHYNHLKGIQAAVAKTIYAQDIEFEWARLPALAPLRSASILASPEPNETLTAQAEYAAMVLFYTEHFSGWDGRRQILDSRTFLNDSLIEGVPPERLGFGFALEMKESEILFRPVPHW
ncbi:hypothetical protein [Cryobacterium sp. Y29]|uniref:hypothetical protein n=1 Tax=Cryobacterium sp. Y29 TaxID=2048285 RepID=UPI000CE2CB93|nr:hypothetical protein [Cryobacterium sp. Y29]